MTVDVPVTIVNNDLDPTDEFPSDGGLVHRTTGDWAANGFVVGQWVMIDGHPGRRLAAARDLERRHDAQARPRLAAAERPAGHDDARLRAGPARRPDVVHGGGNMPLSLAFDNTNLSDSVTVGTDSVTRNDGLAWADDGYAQYLANGQPQHIQVGGASADADDHRLQRRARARTPTRSPAAASAA